MERVEQIRKHPVFLEHLKAIEEMEQGRVFCLHGLEHALDVARIMYIIVMERQLSVPKDVIYGTALLHDIGRRKQYEEGISHHEAGADIAGGILADCGYSQDEIAVMTEAIRRHGSSEVTEISSLDELLYVADKKSRVCYRCEARNECYWDSEKKNERIYY